MVYFHDDFSFLSYLATGTACIESIGDITEKYNKKGSEPPSRANILRKD